MGVQESYWLEGHPPESWQLSQDFLDDLEHLLPIHDRTIWSVECEVPPATTGFYENRRLDVSDVLRGDLARPNVAALVAFDWNQVDRLRFVEACRCNEAFGRMMRYVPDATWKMRYGFAWQVIEQLKFLVNIPETVQKPDEFHTGILPDFKLPVLGFDNDTVLELLNQRDFLTTKRLHKLWSLERGVSSWAKWYHFCNRYQLPGMLDRPDARFIPGYDELSGNWSGVQPLSGSTLFVVNSKKRIMGLTRSLTWTDPEMPLDLSADPDPDHWITYLDTKSDNY